MTKKRHGEPLSEQTAAACLPTTPTVWQFDWLRTYSTVALQLSPTLSHCILYFSLQTIARQPTGVIDFLDQIALRFGWTDNRPSGTGHLRHFERQGMQPVVCYSGCGNIARYTNEMNVRTQRDGWGDHWEIYDKERS